MSVYGGDSWVREANYRKRRVDDLLVEQIHDKSSYANASSSYKKLASGKYACLVCPHNPVLDTPLMLSMHIKGSRHCAAESKLKERELARQAELNKRIALSEDSTSADSSGVRTRQYGLVSKPLTQHTMKAVAEALGTKPAAQLTVPKFDTVKYTENPILKRPSSKDNNAIGQLVADKQFPQNLNYKEKVSQQQLDYKERKEKELKFTAAGWKRDGFGGWYKDETVEFDSDEEDPNDVFA